MGGVGVGVVAGSEVGEVIGSVVVDGVLFFVMGFSAANGERHDNYQLFLERALVM